VCARRAQSATHSRARACAWPHVTDAWGVLMKCPRCQQENPLQAKFCLECAAPLALRCPNCGTQLPAGAKFCFECATPVGGPGSQPRFSSPESYTPKHLAERILTFKAAIEGERKQVTVLFVDVSGFTSLSERLDPEDVHRLMTRAFEVMLAEVHRYEGTVNQFLGDGIMALFGAPIGHEDHAQRAVHAALALRTALEAYQVQLQREQGVSFQVRQGLNTGLVVVGSIGNDLRMDYTAVGDTTNVAARLQQAANGGRILVSEATHRLVGDYFNVRPLGHLSLKGKAEPVNVWEVIAARAARTRLDVEAERGLTPYTGRERELRLLQECFERARTGHGQVVFVVGEPGIGKSRLLYEFRRRLGDEATWLEARCISFGRSIALHPVIDMMKRTFRIEEGDTEAAIGTKVEAGIRLLGEDLHPLGRYVRYLLSVDPGDATVLAMDPRQRRAEIIDTLRQLLARASQLRPQVMVIEDVHWIDKASEESLLHVADSIPGARILQILTYRPGYTQPFGEHSYHTRIALTTLSTEDSVQMAEAVLAAGRLPEELKSLIVTKAEGNPFFVEEVVRSLQELGAIRREGERYVPARRLDEIVIPDTIQDVIMARIDRLEEALKKTLQLASVIGREFTGRLLDRVADIHGETERLLRELKAVELIYEKALFPELAYTFKHALTHDVAYNSLLFQRRKELHRLIGLAIESLYADRLSQRYEVLAHHFSRGEDWPKALDYLLKAAEKSAQAFANREAITFYDQALEATRRLGDRVSNKTLMTIHQARADLYLLLSDFQRACAESEHIRDLARLDGDRVREGAALAGMAWASKWAHDFDRALAYAGEAVQVAEEADAKTVLAAGLFTAGTVRLNRGQLTEATEQIHRALAISRSAGDVGHESLSLLYAGLRENWAGNFTEALPLISQSLLLARERNLLFVLLNGLFIQGIALTGTGRYDDALVVLEEGLALSERIGHEVIGHRLLNSLGWLYLEIGDTDRALDFSRRGADGARHRGDHETIANAEINLGDILVAKGDYVLAQEVLDRTHRLVNDPRTSEWNRWRYSIRLWASLAELWLARGDDARARLFAEQCWELATRSGSQKYVSKGWRLRGEIALLRRQWDAAEGALLQALAVAETVGNPTQIWKTYVAIGRLRTATSKPDAARAAYREARDVIDRVRANLLNPQLHGSFKLASAIPEHQELW
jgi:class 3 adenylate cyclase/tetratricopeptide (TPR) repeat protein